MRGAALLTHLPPTPPRPQILRPSPPHSYLISPQEAYVEYLKSITLISQALQDEAALTGNLPPAVLPPPPHMGAQDDTPISQRMAKGSAPTPQKC